MVCAWRYVRRHLYETAHVLPTIAVQGTVVATINLALLYSGSSRFEPRPEHGVPSFRGPSQNLQTNSRQYLDYATRIPSNTLFKNYPTIDDTKSDTHTHTHTNTHTQTHIHKNAPKHTHTLTHTRKHTHTNTHTLTQTHTHANTYTR